MKSYGDSYYLNRVNEFTESDQHELAIKDYTEKLGNSTS